MKPPDSAAWFQGRAAYPNRELYPPELKRHLLVDGPAWQEVGPLDSGGRLTAIALDSTGPERVYVGSAAGGVWRSEDGGASWVPAWPSDKETLNIGSLVTHPAGDPSLPDLLYCGTGEANGVADNYPGAGLYYSWDRGESWAQIRDSREATMLTSAQQAEAAGSDLSPVDNSGHHALMLPRRIGTIAVISNSRVLVGGISHTESELAGLFEWNKASGGLGAISNVQDGNGDADGAFISPRNYYCHCVRQHPKRADVIFATVEARGVKSGIWISANGGAGWRQAKSGLPSGDQFGRTSLALSPQGKTVWALAAQNGTGELLGVFRSDDLGEVWRKLRVPGLGAGRQLAYANCIAVHPDDADIAIAGSQHLHRTTDGGRTWTKLPGALRFHAVCFASSTRVYAAHDSGFSRSDDGGQTWRVMNQGLAVSLFCSLDVDPQDARRLGGGLQDMGVWFQRPVPGEPPAFSQRLAGDGGWVCFDPLHPGTAYASTAGMILRRDRGKGFGASISKAVAQEDGDQVFQAVVAMTYGRSAGPRGIYLGSTRLWESTDEGKTWFSLEQVFDRSPITAIEIPLRNGDIMYIGTANGGFFRSERLDGENWTFWRNLAGPMSPGRTITRIAADPEDERHVLYCIGSVAEIFIPDVSWRKPSLNLARAGFSRQFRLPGPNDGKRGRIAHDHVYESRDGGNSWSATGVQLPNLPHNALAFGPDGMVFAAHDNGVAVRAGEDWFDLSSQLPNVRVTDLRVHVKDGLLLVSTFGRGIWQVPLAEVKAWVAAQPARPREPAG